MKTYLLLLTFFLSSCSQPFMNGDFTFGKANETAEDATSISGSLEDEEKNQNNTLQKKPNKKQEK